MSLAVSIDRYSAVLCIRHYCTVSPKATQRQLHIRGTIRTVYTDSVVRRPNEAASRALQTQSFRLL